MKNKENKRTLSWKEISWYVASGVLALWGLIYIILGLVINFYPGLSEDLVLNAADKAFTALFGLNFMSWGFILFIGGTILGVIVLCIYATGYDREVEKATRRAQRMGLIHEEEKVVEAEVKETKAEAEETKVEDVKPEDVKADEANDAK